DTWPIWQPCRINTTNSTKTWAQVTLTELDVLGISSAGAERVPTPTGFPVSGVSLVGHNLGPGSLWRVRLLGDTPTPGVPERLAPDASVSSTGVTGAVTDVDEDPYSIDASYIANSGIPASFTLSFPTPAVPPSGQCMARMQFEYDDIADVKSFSMV